MAKVGYIFKSEYYDGYDEDIKWMEDYGCCRVVTELSEHEKQRPQWKQLMECLDRGDEIVISKYSNAVRGSREFAMFIELCRVRVVRIISIHDKIDTKGILFPETTIADVLIMVGSLPEETAALRKESAHVELLKTTVKFNVVSSGRKSKEEEKIEREKNIVNMYTSGFTMDEIWKASGFNSRSSVFRILNKFGVNLNRGKFKGPLGKRKDKDEATEIE